LRDTIADYDAPRITDLVLLGEITAGNHAQA
jgi:hypothetical protein